MSQVREYNHFDKPVNPNVDALRSRADAEHDEAPRLIVALTIAAHFDFCLRLKAFDGMLVASSVFCTRYELSTTSISGVPIGTSRVRARARCGARLLWRLERGHAPRFARLAPGGAQGGNELLNRCRVAPCVVQGRGVVHGSMTAA